MAAQQPEEQEGVAYFRVGDHAFRCATRVSFWLVAKVSHLERKGVTDAEMIPVMYEMVMSMIHPDERARADAILSAMDDLTPDMLNESVANAFAEMGTLPKASATPSPHGSPSPETSTSVRRVSFSRGTVEDVPSETPTDSSTPTVSSTG